MLLIEDAPVAVQLPPSVVLDVVDTPPELKGGTATKRPKPARLNTGIEIMVPEYIVTGERIEVSTATGEFAGRAIGTVAADPQADASVRRMARRWLARREPPA